MWAYAAGVASINDSDNDYTISEIKEMWKKKSLSLTTLLAVGNSKGRDQKSGLEELSRRIGVPRLTISYLLTYFDESIPNYVITNR